MTSQLTHSTESPRAARAARMVVRFAGDSGDGMQLAGERFTAAASAAGNDLATLPNFPAEIRAPQGTLPGVSSFQIQFADREVFTPGDAPDVLVAMNPAALRANVGDLEPGGVVIVDTAEFTPRNLTKAGYPTDPRTDGSLAHLRVHWIDISGMTSGAVAPLGLGRKQASRSRNMFALGLVTWLFSRPTQSIEAWLTRRFAATPAVLEANLAVFRAGWNFGETTEEFVHLYRVARAPLPAGRYRTITGNRALALGLVAAAERAGMPLFLGSYPITPASDILHELARHKAFGVRTFQAEDEIAAIGAALGASYGGALGVTTTSGPGVALKSETIGLAVALELPLVIVDVQRGGPSTGLPTKTEQADLFQALYGRHGEAPIPVIAAQSPADCFAAAFEAADLALRSRTPVMLLSDGYLANGSEPWLLPEVDELPDLRPRFTTAPNAVSPTGTPVYHPYRRDAETFARDWALPGTPGLEHRIGGIEKADLTGDVSYDPDNHQRMVHLRAAKVQALAATFGPLEVDDPHGADFAVLGWGSTRGAIADAVQRARADGRNVARIHLRHLNPLHPDLGDVLRRYRRVLVPELNSGQLVTLVRARYLVDARGFNRVRGVPFKVGELLAAIELELEHL